jgi:hypothetical protein
MDDEAANAMNSGLVSIIAFGRELRPTCIGTGFIVETVENYAIVFFAAHSFYEGAVRSQGMEPRHHHPALPEFLSNYEAVSVDRKRPRALYLKDGRPEMCIITRMLWDKTRDFAIFRLVPQDEKPSRLFYDRFDLAKKVDIQVGDIVGLAGYCNMDASAYHYNSRTVKVKIRRRPIVRLGKVKNIYPKGVMLCKRPCMETSIPVFGGMSGGPAFVVHETIRGPAPVLFGLISSDPDESDELKNDRNHVGSSIVSLLPYQKYDEVKKTIRFRFDLHGASPASD